MACFAGQCGVTELDFIECSLISLESRHDRCMSATLNGGRHVVVGLNYYEGKSNDTLEGVLYDAGTATEIPGSRASLTGHNGIAEV